MEPSVVACLTCKNSSITLPYVLKSLSLINYPRDRFAVVVVDGGSVDSTPEVARDILNSLGLKFKVLVKPSNIPEGRNACVKEALELGADYILFVDCDTLVVNKDFLRHAISASNSGCCPCVVTGDIQVKTFKDVSSLKTFSEETLKNVSSSLSSKPEGHSFISWCGMGLTLIPAEIARKVSFDEDLTFKEDVMYGLKTWDVGYGVLKLNYEEPVAYDLNLIRKSDIYVRMGLKDYFRGFSKKALTYAYTTMTKPGRGGVISIFKDFRYLSYVIRTFSLTLLSLSLYYLFKADLALGFLMFIPAFSMLTLYFSKVLVKSPDVLTAMKSFVKFTLFSFILTFEIPTQAIKHRSKIKEITHKITYCEEKMPSYFERPPQ